jgi:hypothetical protein
MTQVTACPHCGAMNPPNAAFCETCGKALPSGVSSMPRVVGSEGIATTAAGQQLQGEQLHKQAKRASGALLAVAIIMTVVGGLIFFISTQAGRGGGRGTPVLQVNNAAAVITLIIAAVFWGLYIWSRSQPLPAAIVGLVIYATLIVINVITNVSQMGQDGAPRGGLGVGCVDIIIMVVLAQAISAGVQHRKLLRQQAQAAPYTP